MTGVYINETLRKNLSFWIFFPSQEEKGRVAVVVAYRDCVIRFVGHKWNGVTLDKIQVKDRLLIKVIYEIDLRRRKRTAKAIVVAPKTRGGLA